MSESPIRVGIGDDEPVAAGVQHPPLTPPPATSQPESERIDLFEPPTRAEMSSKSALAALEETLAAAPVDVELVRVRVPRRQGVTLLFDPSKIDSTKRKAWRQRATKRSRRPGAEPEIDDFLFSCLVLANTHVGTLMNGQDAVDEEGTPLTFAHARLWRAVGARDPQECIEKLFQNDQHVTVASGDVLLASGLDDDLAADPTQG